MQIEKVNENKIKIILNLEDLKEKNIDLHSFMSSSIDSQALFYDMLDKAEQEIGFKTQDYKLMIEALAIPEGTFILIITRSLPEQEEKKKIKVKRKSISLKNNLSIYMFNTFDDYLEFCNYMKGHLNSTYTNLKNSSLYEYNSKYYLCINDINSYDFNFLNHSFVEFATHINNSDLFKRKLIEYGKVILKTDAINTCIVHFCTK